MHECFISLEFTDQPVSKANDFFFIDRIHQTVEIETNTVEIEEKGIRLRLTVVDTPGFADAVDNTDW